MQEESLKACLTSLRDRVHGLEICSQVQGLNELKAKMQGLWDVRAPSGMSTIRDQVYSAFINRYASLSGSPGNRLFPELSDKDKMASVWQADPSQQVGRITISDEVVVREFSNGVPCDLVVCNAMVEYTDNSKERVTIKFRRVLDFSKPTATELEAKRALVMKYGESNVVNPDFRASLLFPDVKFVLGLSEGFVGTWEGIAMETLQQIDPEKEKQFEMYSNYAYMAYKLHKGGWMHGDMHTGNFMLKNVSPLGAQPKMNLRFIDWDCCTVFPMGQWNYAEFHTWNNQNVINNVKSNRFPGLDEQTAQKMFFTIKCMIIYDFNRLLYVNNPFLKFLGNTNVKALVDYASDFFHWAFYTSLKRGSPTTLLMPWSIFRQFQGWNPEEIYALAQQGPLTRRDVSCTPWITYLNDLSIERITAFYKDVFEDENRMGIIRETMRGFHEEFVKQHPHPPHPGGVPWPSFYGETFAPRQPGAGSAAGRSQQAGSAAARPRFSDSAAAARPRPPGEGGGESRQSRYSTLPRASPADVDRAMQGPGHGPSDVVPQSTRRWHAPDRKDEGGGPT